MRRSTALRLGQTTRRRRRTSEPSTTRAPRCPFDTWRPVGPGPTRRLSQRTSLLAYSAEMRGHEGRVTVGVPCRAALSRRRNWTWPDRTPLAGQVTRTLRNVLGVTQGPVKQPESFAPAAGGLLLAVNAGSRLRLVGIRRLRENVVDAARSAAAGLIVRAHCPAPLRHDATCSFGMPSSRLVGMMSRNST
jgi:hypothetical protein